MAFDHRVDISQMMLDLSSLVDRFDTVVKPDQEKQLREFARANNLDEDAVIAESGAAICTVVRIEFPSAKHLE